MAEKFLMPKLSPTMEEGQIARWIKNEGDNYDAGDTLAEVDTDKATMEMTALSGGTLLKILKGAGDTALLGEAIAIIGKAGEDISGLLAEVGSNGAAKSDPPGSADGTTQERPATEVTEKKVAKTAAPATMPPIAAAPAGNGRLIVSPIAARMAAENSIDLRSITGSGPNGRIIKRDVEAAMEGGGQPSIVSSQPRTFVASTVVGASAYTDENTSKMRQIIASRLAESIGPIPTFYLTVEIEMDNTLELRKQVNASVSDDQKISVNDIVVKAAAMSLVKHPFANASYQDKTIRFYQQADIGVAVAIDEGLITPVVRGGKSERLPRNIGRDKGSRGES